nr:uncharacterized protein CTRU02_09871 [Colletotrichum truncatum]KAF6788058.1 hypothetical protein CTRU02_09871 [Colletotrichum truncatum]
MESRISLAQKPTDGPVYDALRFAWAICKSVNDRVRNRKKKSKRSSEQRSDEWDLLEGGTVRTSSLLNKYEGPGTKSITEDKENSNPLRKNKVASHKKKHVPLVIPTIVLTTPEGETIVGKDIPKGRRVQGRSSTYTEQWLSYVRNCETHLLPITKSVQKGLVDDAKEARKNEAIEKEEQEKRESELRQKEEQERLKQEKRRQSQAAGFSLADVKNRINGNQKEVLELDLLRKERQIQGLKHFEQQELYKSQQKEPQGASMEAAARKRSRQERRDVVASQWETTRCEAQTHREKKHDLVTNRRGATGQKFTQPLSRQ